jgi:hypothetical protein
MVQNEDPILRIVVGPEDTLADLLRRVREHRGRPVYLTVPGSSPLFLTASEFRALRETVRSHGVNFTLISDDPQRRDFANLFNLAAARDEPQGWPAAEVSPGTPAADPALGPPSRQRRPLGSRATGDPSPESSPVSAPAQGWASSWPQRQENDAPAAGWPQRADTVAQIDAGEAASQFPLAVVIPEPVTPKKRRRWPWVTALVLLIVAGLAAAGLFVPSATITITSAHTPITTSVVFAVTAPGTINQPSDTAAFTVSGTRQQTTVTVSATVPATGQQSVPGDPSTGTVAFANPAEQAVTLPAGTQLTSDQALVFTLTTDVAVPAATNAGSGMATGTVTATTGGTAGNLPQGALSGRLDNGIYFNNRDAALTGGTDLTQPVVTDADIANATGQLDTLLPEQASTALSDAAGSPVQVVPGSISHPAFSPTSDVPSGTQAAQVTASATTNVTLLTYDAAAVEDQLESTALSLATTAAGGTFDEDSIEIGAPTAVEGDPTGGLVEVPVTVDRLTDLDDAQIDQLRDDVATKSIDEATGIVAAAVPNAESVAIEIEPDWWPGDRLPVMSDRIDVVVQ